MRAYAAAAGINAGTLQWWMTRLRKGHETPMCAPAQPQFVPLVVSDRTRDFSIEIRMRSGHVVCASSDVDTAILARLVRALDAAC